MSKFTVTVPSFPEGSTKIAAEDIRGFNINHVSVVSRGGKTEVTVEYDGTTTAEENDV